MSNMFTFFMNVFTYCFSFISGCKLFGTISILEFIIAFALINIIVASFVILANTGKKS